MHDLILRWPKDLLLNQRKLVFALASLTFWVILPAFAEPSSLAPQVMTSQQAKWTTGPARVDLGKVAEFNFPEGYRFVDPAGARILLGQKSVSPSLLGILQPDSAAWMAILEFGDSGYVKPSTAKWINADAVLQATEAKVEMQNGLRKRQGAPPITSVKWAVAPEYDSTNNSLVYAMQIEAGGERVVNPSFRFFGRNGILAVTILQKSKVPPDVAAIKEVLSNLAFKSGQRYSDFQEGDKLSSSDMFNLITGDEQNMVVADKGWKAYFNRRTNIWIVSILGVCIFALVIYLITKEIRSITTRQSFHASSAPHDAGIKMRKSRRAFKEIDAAGRRRAFDYQKFYSDMMMQVSTRSYTGMTQQPEEEVPEETSGVSPAAADTKDSASELIARQKDFIEEQRRLMQQQTKLIEERSKLIEEKNQLLAKQSEMMDHLL